MEDKLRQQFPYLVYEADPVSTNAMVAIRLSSGTSESDPLPVQLLEREIPPGLVDKPVGWRSNVPYTPDSRIMGGARFANFDELMMGSTP